MVKEKLLEYGFVEEMKTTWVNEKMPQTLFHYFPRLQKSIWFFWLRTIGNTAFWTYDIRKGWLCKLQNFLQIVECHVFYSANSARNFVKWQFLAEWATQCLIIIEDRIH